jgi:hypothetical protein
MTISVRMVELTMPPIIGAAILFMTSAPVPGDLLAFEYGGSQDAQSSPTNCGLCRRDDRAWGTLMDGTASARSTVKTVTARFMFKQESSSDIGPLVSAAHSICRRLPAHTFLEGREGF